MICGPRELLKGFGNEWAGENRQALFLEAFGCDVARNGLIL
jgi:hypothetical protein